MRRKRRREKALAWALRDWRARPVPPRDNARFAVSRGGLRELRSHIAQIGDRAARGQASCLATPPARTRPGCTLTVTPTMSAGLINLSGGYDELSGVLDDIASDDPSAGGKISKFMAEVQEKSPESPVWNRTAVFWRQMLFSGLRPIRRCSSVRTPERRLRKARIVTRFRLFHASRWQAQRGVRRS